MNIAVTEVEKRTKFFTNIFAFGALAIIGAFALLAMSNYSLPEPFWPLYDLFFPPYVPGIALYLVFSLWVSALIAKMAWKKGRSWNAFFTLSLFFPVISWIVAAVISTDQATVMSGTKKCPKCAEMIKQEAILCKHCGSEV
jgi:branched-subunit amino acid ABC-type transport system permease component